MSKNCYACTTPLVSQFPDRTDIEQYDNALFVEFHGSYGEFVDVTEEHSPYKAVICHECAHALCDAVPWINKLIEPHNSHAHRFDYIKQHPDHYGWDYEYRKNNHETTT